MTDAPIFVVGPPRCGTTLVARLLGAHPDLFFGGETHFFDHVYEENGRELGDAAAKRAALARVADVYARANEPEAQRTIERLLENEDDRQRLEQAMTYAELFDALMSQQASLAGKRRWGNHCPRDVFHTDAIFRFFPDARLIACVRDVRGFLASYKNQWKTADAANARRKRSLYHPVLTSLLWRGSIARIERAHRLAPDRVRVVRYESLASEPANELDAICDFVGVAATPSMLEGVSSNSSYTDSEEGIFQSSIERWRDELDPAEVSIAEKVAGRYLTDFGYRPLRPRISTASTIAAISSLPIAAFDALRANRDHRGPLLPYVARRLRALRSSLNTRRGD